MSDNAISMKIDANRIIQLRNQRAWSQHHLAEVCGLSLRTIQRVEKESKASQETVKALACIFEMKPADLLISQSEDKLADVDAVKSNPKNKHSGLKTKFLLPASGILVILIATFLVPVTSATGVEVQADTAIYNRDASETFIGNVSISIPSGYDTEIGATTMWTAGDTNVFEGEVYIEITLNGHRYQMQNAVVTETESGINISTDVATLVTTDILR